MSSSLLKEVDRLCKKQKIVREVQLEKLGEMCRLVEEARDELRQLGIRVLSPPPLAKHRSA